MSLETGINSIIPSIIIDCEVDGSAPSNMTDFILGASSDGEG